MFDNTPYINVIPFKSRHLSVVLPVRSFDTFEPIPPNLRLTSYEKLIEGDAGIRVEAFSNEIGSPIIAINRINRDGEFLCADDSFGGITCHHHYQNIVCEIHHFGLFDYWIEVDASYACLTVQIKRTNEKDHPPEIIVFEKIYWNR